MRFGGLQKLSTVDYPGLPACVVFVQGCNLDCYFCHNRALLDLDADVVSESEIAQFLDQRHTLLDGLVISGGEPLLQPDLIEFAARWRAAGYQIKIDTNGTCPDRLAALLHAGVADYIAVDYKAPWSLYDGICAADAAQTAAIAESLTLLARSSAAWELRTTVIPELNEEALRQMATAIPIAPIWYLQPYRPPALVRPEDRERVQRPAPSREELKHLAEALSELQPGCRARQ